MKKITVLTHWLALGAAAVGGFLVTPAGQAILHQYPVVSSVVGTVSVIAALYKNPTTKQ